MKKTFTSIFILMLAIQTYSQSPQAFNYQAVARSNSGQALTNQTIGIRISILSGSVTGVSVYQEAHNITTNDYGLFTLQVGAGTNISGLFSSIDWAGERKYIEVAVDPSGGTSYQVISTAQLLSVPYALFSEKSGGDADADPYNEIQDLSFLGSDLSITNGSTVNLSSLNTDEQELGLLGASISITNGNSIDLTDLISDNDDDPTNEIQDLQLTGNILTITVNGSATSIDLSPYLDNTNLTEPQVEEFITNSAVNLFAGTTLNSEAINDWHSLDNIPADISDGDQDEQDLTLSGTTLLLSGDPTSVSLSPFVSPWTTSGSNIYRTSGNIGIGTTSPVAGLHVYANRDALFGASMSGNGAKFIWDYSSRAIRAGYAANSSWNPDSIGLYSAAFGFGSLAEAYMSFAHGFYTRARTYAGFSIGRYNAGASGTPTAWSTSDPLFEVGNGTSNISRNNAFTIRKDGRVGINDATPDYLFDIENHDLSLRSIYINHDNTSSSSTMYGIFVNADNTASNSGVSYAGYFDMTNNNDDAYGIYSLAFCDALDGSPAYAVRSYVDNDNGTGWAYAIYGSVSGSTTGSKYAGYFNGDVYTTGTYLPSDKKLKSNIQPATENSTQKLMQVQVANFEYLKNTYAGMNLPKGLQTGLIAQDIEKLFPELVKESVQPGPSPEEINKGALPAEDVIFKAVDYTRLIPHLLKAIQEQQAEIEALKNRISAIEN